jgi:hypothetical protein
MTNISESNKSFLGLLLYAGSHILCIYYLVWILLYNILDHVEA